MIAGLAEVLGAGREYFLFDSFEGLPPAREELDGASAVAWQKNSRSPAHYNNCTAAQEEAAAAMKLSGATSFSLVKGWFNETLPRFSPPNEIAVLRLDGDWYESTRVCLENLYPHVAPGGIVIIELGAQERDELARRPRDRGSRSRPPSARSPAPPRARAPAARRARASSRRRRRAVEAADADVDRVDLAAAEQRHHLVAGLLQREPALDGVAGGPAPSRWRSRSRGSRARAACRCAARGSRSTRRSRAAGAARGSARRPRRRGVLHRVHGAHLVGDRADAADARGDVGRLGERAAAQERLEEARRLEDAQLDVARRAPSWSRDDSAPSPSTRAR